MPQTHTPAEESALLKACRDGEPGAFERLYTAYKDQAYALALAMSGRPDLAEEVTQLAFLRVHRSLQDFRAEARFSTWLHRIVANLSIDLRRKESRARFVSLDVATSEQLTARDRSDGDVLARDLAQQLSLALERLAPDAREALLLKYFAGMSYDEIALVQECNKGTVGSRIHRGLQALREHLLGMEDHV
jgi:RNA polymerase sigma-70 factor (ECF subfamily)